MHVLNSQACFFTFHLMRNQTWFCLSAAPQFVRLNICMFFVCESYRKQQLNKIHFHLPCEQVSMFWFEDKKIYDYPSLMSLSQSTVERCTWPVLLLMLLCVFLPEQPVFRIFSANTCRKIFTGKRLCCNQRPSRSRYEPIASGGGRFMSLIRKFHLDLTPL